MATIIDSLLITMGVDSKGVKSGMARAENAIASSAKNIITNILTPLAAALALGSAFKEYVSGAQAAAALSETLGVGQEDVQAWGEAVNRAGGSVEGLNGTLSAINAKMLEFSTTGSSSAAPVLAQLGISARNANGSIKSSIDILQDLAGVAGSIDPKRFQALAGSLVDSGTLMLLKQGSISVQELVARQKALGVYTKEDSAVALKMANAFKDLLQVFKSVSSIVMRQVIPPLSWLTGKIVDLVVFLKEHDVFLRGVIVGIAAALTAALLPAIVRVGAAMLANPLTWIFAAIAAVVISVAAVIEDLYVYMKGGNSALEGFWSKFGSGEEIAVKLSKAWENIKVVLNGVLETIKTLLPFVLRAVGGFIAAKVVIGIISGIASAVTAVISVVKSLSMAWTIFSRLIMANPIGAALTALIIVLMLIIDNWDTIKAAAGKAFDFIADKLSAFKNRMAEMASGVKAFLQPLIDWVMELAQTVSKFLDPIIETVSGLKDTVGGFISGIGSGIGKVSSFFGFGGEPTATPAMSLPGGVVNNAGGSKVINSSSNVSVGNVNIQTNATDAKTIAREIPGELGNSFDSFIPAANTGMFLK